MLAGKTAHFDTSANDVTFASGIGSATTAALAKYGTGSLLWAAPTPTPAPPPSTAARLS
jgi:hypothetical protein